MNSPSIFSFNEDFRPSEISRSPEPISNIEATRSRIANIYKYRTGGRNELERRPYPRSTSRKIFNTKPIDQSASFFPQILDKKYGANRVKNKPKQPEKENEKKMVNEEEIEVSLNVNNSSSRNSKYIGNQRAN